MLDKLKRIRERYDLLGARMSEPDAMNDRAAWTEMAREHASLEETVTLFNEYERIGKEIRDCHGMLDEKPDAVFCGDDYRACRLLQAAYRRGIRVPDVFGVAGFGNTVAGQFSSPALTTVDEPYFDIGVISMRKLIFRLEGKSIPESTPAVGKIIVRDSTKNIQS